jgi:hypothetical protein
MFSRFRRGPIPAEHGQDAYVSVQEYPGTGYDGSQDRKTDPRLVALHSVDPALVAAHEAEEHVGP